MKIKSSTWVSKKNSVFRSQSKAKGSLLLVWTPPPENPTTTLRSPVTKDSNSIPICQIFTPETFRKYFMQLSLSHYRLSFFLCVNRSANHACWILFLGFPFFIFLVQEPCKVLIFRVPLNLSFGVVSFIHLFLGT